jgi:UDP-glucuronate decarboxylase
MKFLLTGAAGFVGSHLAESLLSDGHEIIGMDNFYTGSEENVHKLLQYPKFEMIQHDITLPVSIEADYILNLACPASPVHYQKNPVQTIETSVLGISNMLGIAKAQRIPLFQASTSEVYGDPNESPQTENYWGNVNPIGIRSCYDEGKRVAETMMFDYHRQYGVDIKVARIFNTYGPRMQINDGRVVSNFVVSALKGEDITIYGNGSQTRSFCYVDDLVKGIKAMIFHSAPTLGPINLGNPIDHTISQLAEMVLKLTNSKSRVTQLELPLDDPKQRKPDISQANQILNWYPEIDLQSGLLRTIEYFKTKI